MLAIRVTWQCGAKNRTLSSSCVPMSSATERPQVFPMCVGQGLTRPASLHVSRELLSPYIKDQSLCFSLQSMFPAGSSRLRMDRRISGPFVSWQSTQPTPHLRTSQEPFNTGKVSKNTHRGQRDPLSRMQCTVPWAEGQGW